MAASARFYPELEGVRGYAFVVVFLTHFTYPLMLARHRWTFPFRVCVDLAWLAVPVFFVLSGFLITNILLRTRGRQRYFQTFYARRAIRVFPLYFLIMLGVGAIGLFLQEDLRGYWTNLLYVQNVWPARVNLMRGIVIGGVQVQLTHFWSLAIEEQFYLVWPLIVWMCRGKCSLVRVSFGLIGAATVFRCMAPLFHLTPQQSYFLTFTRADAVVLGALLSIWHGQAMYKRLERMALPVALIGIGTLLTARVLTGASNPYLGDGAMWRVSCMIPVVNLTAMAIVLETMRQGSRLQRVCQWKPACHLGSMSYACYAFHLLYCLYCCEVLVPLLEQHMPRRLAILMMLSASFCLTVLLGRLSYRLLEAPAMRCKERFTYGEMLVMERHFPLLVMPAGRSNLISLGLNGPFRARALHVPRVRIIR